MQDTLEELEFEGIAYYDEEHNIYRTMPSNYFVTTAEVTRKGCYNVSFNGISYILPYDSATGILPFDKVLLKRE